MSLGGFGRDAERFSDIDDVALERAQHHLDCPDCRSRDLEYVALSEEVANKDRQLSALTAEAARLRLAVETARGAIDRLITNH